jgi:hypothetical protein
MSERVSFHCPYCNSRLRAPARSLGRSSPCPSCKKTVTVPAVIPEEAGPLLVWDGAPRLSEWEIGTIA